MNGHNERKGFIHSDFLELEEIELVRWLLLRLSHAIHHFLFHSVRSDQTVSSGMVERFSKIDRRLGEVLF